jgi:hypothetical protein
MDSVKKSLTLVFVLVVGVELAGCRSALFKPASSIVREIEDVGSGDVSKADAGSFKPWFARQPLEFKKKVRGECTAAAKGADATWRNTDEGKVCVAVLEYCAWGGCAPPIRADR